MVFVVHFWWGAQLDSISWLLCIPVPGLSQSSDLEKCITGPVLHGLLQANQTSKSWTKSCNLKQHTHTHKQVTKKYIYLFTRVFWFIMTITEEVIRMQDRQRNTGIKKKKVVIFLYDYKWPLYIFAFLKGELVKSPQNNLGAVNYGKGSETSAGFHSL